MNRKILILTGALVSQTFHSFAQQQPAWPDTLTLRNGQVKNGQFMAGTADSIHWKEKGFPQIQSIARTDISGIRFGKKTASLPPERKTAAIHAGAYKPHTVAVLPINYMANMKEGMHDDMPYLLQELVIAYLGSSAQMLTIIDQAEINALLKKKGISHDDLKSITPAELADMLQVAYVLTGYVMQEAGNSSTVSNNSGSKEISADHSNNKTKVKVKNHGSSYSSTFQDVKTTVMVKIYDHTGKLIFHESRKSILSSGDAYKKSLQYLLKRTPLYKK